MIRVKKDGKCCNPKSVKSGYTKGDLYKDASGKKILKGLWRV